MNFLVDHEDEERQNQFFGIYLEKVDQGTYAQSHPWILFMADSVDKKVSHSIIYITEHPISERSNKLRLDPVPFTITQYRE